MFRFFLELPAALINALTLLSTRLSELAAATRDQTAQTKRVADLLEAAQVPADPALDGIADQLRDAKDRLKASTDALSDAADSNSER